MAAQQKADRFQEAISPHLGAAYNYARWLMRGHQDAEDIVQEACVRAFEYFESSRGENQRAWLLTIVRNTCFNWFKSGASKEIPMEIDDEIFEREQTSPDAHTLLLRHFDANRLREGIEGLSIEYREVIVLRELEDLSYKEISEIAKIPIGTVMSRLARARTKLQEILSQDPEGSRK
jgi:RNA polymerase sigma factor (sigma-70 family)